MITGVTDGFYNIDAGKDVAIRELAEIVLSVIGFPCSIVCDARKPDGPPRKWLDVGRLRQMGWPALTPLRKGIALAYRGITRRHAG